MKKILFLALALLLASANISVANALGNIEGINYTAFTLNYSYQDIHTDVDGINLLWDGADNKLAHGFNAGFFVQQSLYKNLVIVTGLQYQFTARFCNDISLSNLTDLSSFLKIFDKGNIKYYNHNIVVPLKFGFSMVLGSKSCISIYGGPSLNFCVSTKSYLKTDNDNYIYTDMVSGKLTGMVDGEKYTTTSSDYKTMGWFDIPLGVGAVAKFGRFGIRFEYEWGMVDRWKGDGKFRADQLTAGLAISF